MPPKKLEILHENEVNLDSLKIIFERDSFGVFKDEDSLLVECNKVKVVVFAIPDLKLIALSSSFGLVDSVSLQTKVMIVNKFNDAFPFIRFSIPVNEDNSLCIDYELCFQGGITFSQLTSTLRFFSATLLEAVKKRELFELIKK